MIRKVVISKRARRALEQVPIHISRKLFTWVDWVEEKGLEEVRKIAGYHDEQCQGELWGLRSIRLNRAYRAYYRIEKESVEFVLVERVDKHVY